MYDSIDLTVLRQGDVLKEIHVPRMPLNDCHLLVSIKDGKPIEKGVVPLYNSYVVVISQCCEFNADKRTAFALAPMFPVESISYDVPLPVGLLVCEMVPFMRSAFRGKSKDYTANLCDLMEANTINLEEKN